MFDDLTLKPACDDPSVVRYNPSTGAITAATPARLVAEITSPSFLDYDLLSDFFLTFRAFLSTADLLAMLFARLRWALARDDEIGMIVRVRTFVAIRHWILNYFMDDFVGDYDLRQGFCKLMNDFVDEISSGPIPKPNKLKILTELKKCWRRTCGLYWNGPRVIGDSDSKSPLAIGGGSGGSEATPGRADDSRAFPGAPHLEEFVLRPASSGAQGGAPEASHTRQFQNPEPVLQETRGLEEEAPLSPQSVKSEDFVSCSLPSKSRAPPVGPRMPLAAHPVHASNDHAPAIATTPRALTGKRVRPAAHAHNRSGSFSDSLRGKQSQGSLAKSLYKETELLMSLPFAGSLVRGNVLPPAQPYLEALAPATPSETSMVMTLSPWASAGNNKEASAMSGPGMRRLLGSVRRALSTKNGQSPIAASPTAGSFPHLRPSGHRGATTNRLPGSAVVPQSRSRLAGPNAPMRIDLLGAEAAEDFRKAVRDDSEASEEREGKDGSNIRSQESTFVPPVRETRSTETLRQQEVTAPGAEGARSRAAVSEMTMGSESIVIVDDTTPALYRQPPTAAAPLDMPTPPDSGADALADPTPPHTPPGLLTRVPHRSSVSVDQHSSRIASVERTPSLIRAVHRTSELYKSSSGDIAHRRSHAPSRKSVQSISLRRYASYHSGFTRHATERSFDATTISGSLYEPEAPPPLRVLRRRPGGDLRAATNVGELEILPSERPRSAGSLGTYSDSFRSSYVYNPDQNDFVDIAKSEDSPTGRLNFSLGALAESTPKEGTQIFSTRSSHPIMRPSFEAEAQRLAQIPDDDDGGVESALMKLEGKFEERRSPSLHASPLLEAGQQPPASLLLQRQNSANDKRRHRENRVVEQTISVRPPLATYKPQDRQRGSTEALKPAVYRPRAPGELAIRNQHQSMRSQDSYSSIPLLDRSSGIDQNQEVPRDSTKMPAIHIESSNRAPFGQPTPESLRPSFDFTERADRNMGRVSGEAGSTAPSLYSQSDNATAMSSDLSLEVVSRMDATPVNELETASGAGALDTGVGGQTRTPPMSSSVRVPSGEPSSRPQSGQFESMDKPLPPTPSGFMASNDADAAPSHSFPPVGSGPPVQASRKSSVHLPFILAFDSEVLAQQFTLIEKDALHEIDWKELIEMRWKNSSSTSRSWVEFLRTQNARGVEVVIARFNIMVKWAISECVLTESLEERARCIIKYIHIAEQCRKHHNYATMYQLTVALTSHDLSRLTQTWQRVPATDLQTLRELETLIQPSRNFHKLRQEMESSGPDRGCIPFIGVYTHDLLFNSQRPSQIPSTPTTEPLVNFERCRYAAAIVKNLLRLIEASSLYKFQPIEGVTDRCLWMAALSDEQIRKFAERIE